MTLYDFRRNPVTPTRNGRPPAPREHGSERGYQQHHHDGTRPCGPCLYAHQVHNTTPP